MSAFTLMTWNVENLFLPSHEDGPETIAAFERKIASLTAVIDQVQPDVLALQEVGPDDALGRLQAALTHQMPHAIEGEPGDRGIRVAFLSTQQFQSSRHLRPFPDRVHPIQAKDLIFDNPATPENEALTAMMGRGALEVSVDIGGTVVTVLNAHFKSKLINYPRQPGVVGGSQFQPNDEGERYRYAAYALFKRTGDAMTIRQRLNEILADPNDPDDITAGLGRTTAVAFCGDLNDEPKAATTQIIQGPSGSELKTDGFKHGDQGDGFRMWNLAPLLPDVDGKPAFTRIYKGRGELIDHIFASHKLVNPQNMPTARTIMAMGDLPSIGDIPTVRRNEPGSDHAAVVATFEI